MLARMAHCSAAPPPVMHGPGASLSMPIPARCFATHAESLASAMRPRTLFRNHTSVFGARPGRWRPEAPVRAWLFRVAGNLAIDALRRRRHTVEMEPDHADAAPAIEDRLSEKEQAQTVWRLVSELPERQRMALVLCRLEGMSMAEAGSVLGCSVGAVESLLSRARQQLRESLDADSRASGSALRASTEVQRARKPVAGKRKCPPRQYGGPAMSRPRGMRRVGGGSGVSTSVPELSGPGGRTQDERQTTLAGMAEAMLNSWQVPAMRPDLRRRLLSIPALEPVPARPLWRRAQTWFAAGGFAAATALGAVIGVSPIGEIVEHAVGLDPTPEDELVAMLDVFVEDTLR